jgi:hypothetical protein
MLAVFQKSILFSCGKGNAIERIGDHASAGAGNENASESAALT